MRAAVMRRLMRRLMCCLEWCSAALAAVAVTGCTQAEKGGPGFTVSYMTDRRDIWYDKYTGGADPSLVQDPRFMSTTDTGAEWPWSMGGTESGAPDSRGLPEWIEFKWREVPLNAQIKTFEDWVPIRDALPIKTYRVPVRSQVPQSVIDELMQSKRERVRGKLPKKRLLLTFSWVGDEIKFGWKMTVTDDRGVETTLRQGGGPSRF
jgi:hypothetical protein